MDGVKRYGHISYLVEASPQMLKLYPEMTVYVLASDFDAALAREAELQELSARVRRDLIDSENREAALREELTDTKSLLAEVVRQHGSVLGEVIEERDSIQQRLTSAEQRNAELVELLDSAFFRLDTFIEAEREMPVPSMEVLRDAILRHCPTLKPEEPGPIQVDCGECPNITDGCHGSCMKAKPTESGASDKCAPDGGTCGLGGHCGECPNVESGESE